MKLALYLLSVAVAFYLGMRLENWEWKKAMEDLYRDDL